MPPTSIAHYDIGEKIGAGGMGEVYRARDTKLNRDVALKLLPDDVSSDRDRMARFEREAHVLASLNHPNIAAIYGFEEQDGTRALVLELVDGETLSDRAARGPIPLEEALDIARQIAEALEAAHEVGIIHRDLKPANVIVTDDGHVKVLDFGLAKALEGAPDEDAETSPTLSFAATRAGVILGTAAYMSPEQARGHRADRRSDIWSFGVVLYEMLSGERLFTGDTPSDVLAHVLTAEPRWAELDVPSSVRSLLRRCLTRERKQRLQAIGEARIALATPSMDPKDAPEPELGVAGMGAKVPWVLSALLAAGLVVSVWLSLRSPGDSSSSLRLDVRLSSEGTELVDTNVFDGAASVLSPDGRTLAFVASGLGDRRQIYLRPLDQLNATALSGADEATTPFFSPDGRWLAFFKEGTLERVSISGGSSLTIAEAADARGGAWGPDGTIVYAPNTNSGLYQVAASGGAPVELTKLEDGERSHRWPSFLPSGRAVLYISQAVGGSYDDADVEAVLLETGERRVVHRGGTFPRYFPSGHLLFVREGTLFAVRFDADRLEITGEPTPVLAGIHVGVSGAAQYAFSDGGALVYTPGGPSGSRAPIAVADRAGAVTLLAPEPARFADLHLSPDETLLALSIGDAVSRNVHVLDLERGAMSRLTFDGLRNSDPIWSPDGSRIVFGSDQHGASVTNLYAMRSDGAGAAQRLTTSLNPQEPGSFSPDGTRLVYMDRGSETGQDLWVVSMEGNEEPEPFLVTPADEREASFSPDGRWIAYSSDESGGDQVYVRPFPGPGGKYPVSIAEGRAPRWTKGGRELIYIEHRRWMAVSVSTEGDVFRAETPELLFEGDFAGFGPWGYYDVSADGEKFFVLPRPEREAERTHVTLIVDFAEEVRRLTGE